MKKFEQSDFPVEYINFILVVKLDSKKWLWNSTLFFIVGWLVSPKL